MAGTATAAWLAAMRDGTKEPVWVIELQVSASVTYYAASDENTMGYDVALLGPPSGIGASVDPVTRRTLIENVSIGALDAWARPIVTGYLMRSAILTLKSGTRDLAIGDYRTERTYMVEDYSIDSARGGVTFHATDALSFALKQKIRGEWVNMHPLEVFEAILTRCGVPAALIDSTSFDPTTYTSTFSHWVVDNAGGEEFATEGDPRDHQGRKAVVRRGDRASGMSLLEELQTILPGIVYVADDGVIKFIEYDKTAAAQAHLTVHEYRNLRQDDAFSLHYNAASIAVGPSDAPAEYVTNNDDSQSDYAYQGTSARILSHVSSCGFLSSWAQLSAFLGIDDEETTFGIELGRFWGFCGTRLASAGSSSYDTDTEITGSRPAYWLIDDEVVEVTAFPIDANTYGRVAVRDGDRDDETAQYVPVRSNSSTTTVVRAQKGTTGALHARLVGTDADDGHGVEYTKIYDVTIAVALTEYLAERFGYGCPVVRLERGMVGGIRQLGDFLTLDSDEVAAYGLDGVSSSTKWEVVGKRLLDGGEGYELALAFVQTVVPTFVIGIVRPDLRSNINDMIAAAHAVENMLPHIAQGLLLTTPSGLDLNIAPGRGGIGPVRRRFANEFGQAVTASKDTYATMDAATGAIIFREVTTGAGDPGHNAHEALIGHAVAGAASISSVTDGRSYAMLNGNRMVDRSIKKDKIDMPIARAYLAGAATIAVADGWKRIPFDTVDFDLGTPMLIATKVYQADITEPGVYDISAKAQVAALGAGYTARLRIYVTGANAASGESAFNDSGAARTEQVEVSRSSIELLSTDVVEIYIASTDPAALTITATALDGFEIRRVH